MNQIYAIKKNGKTYLQTVLGDSDTEGIIKGVWNYDEFYCIFVKNAFIVIGTEQRFTVEESFRLVINHENPETFILGNVYPINQGFSVTTELGMKKVEALMQEEESRTINPSPDDGMFI